MNQRLNARRGLLKSAGMTLALPALESIPRQAVAAETTVGAESSAKAKRLICVGSNLGLYRNAFYPTRTGVDYDVTPLLKPIDQHRHEFTVFSGLDHRAGNGHSNWDNYLCGQTIGSVSLDQIAAEKVGKDTRYGSLQLCAGDIPRQRMVFTRRGVPLPMINRPSVVYGKMFASADDRARTEYLLKSGRSALDKLRDEAKSLQRQVNAADKHKLSEYFSSLRELEQRMGRQLNHLAEDAPQVDYELPPYDPIAPTMMLECEQIMFDLMALALQTDSTRVATLFIAGLGQVFTLDGQTMRAGYHALSHHGNDPDLIRDLIRVETEHMKCLGRFLSQLKEKTDGDGRPLLDTTIVLFGTGMGDASRHSNRDLPTLVAGGGFKHGRHIAGDPTAKDGMLLGDVFISVLQQLGVETETFSNARRGIEL
ncbi:MAG: DUF1552 domain-containing protein [Pirellulaceae bacterium]|nr:DUF1552 domain-containing protein [Pirellulaceae bacterium]